MNPDTPPTPREEREARLTALLMGELSAEEAADVQAQMAADPELAALHARLRQAIELLREASALPEPALPTPAKFSTERRERLLAHFKRSAPATVVVVPRWNWREFVPAGVAATLIALLGWGVLFKSVLLESPLVAPDFSADSGEFVSSAPMAAPPADSDAELYRSLSPDAPQAGAPRISAITTTNGGTSRFQIATPAQVARSGAAGGGGAGLAAPTTKSEALAKAEAGIIFLPSSAADGTSSFRADGPVTARGSVATPIPSVQLFARNSYPGATPVPTAAGRIVHEDRFGTAGTIDPLRSAGEMGWAFNLPGAITSTAAPSPRPSAPMGENFDFLSSTAATPAQPQTPLVAEALSALDHRGARLQSERELSAIATRNMSEGTLNIGGSTFGGATPENKGASAGTAGTLSAEFGEAGGITGLSAAKAKEVGRFARGKALADQSQEAAAAPSSALGELLTADSVAYFKQGIAPELRGNVDELKQGVANDGDFFASGKNQLALKSAGQDFAPAFDDDAAGVFRQKLKQVDDKDGATGPEHLRDGKKSDTAMVTRGLEKTLKPLAEDAPASTPKPNAPEPQPEVETKTNAFSTFSLNVTDVGFKLAGASLEQGKMPEPATVRSEEFLNAFDYRDPEPAAGAPLAFACEQARYPFAQNRDLLRLSVKTAAAGRQPGRALNIVLLIDNSGSMERADRVRILHEALRVLSEQLQPADKLSVVTFSRTSRLWADGVAGDKAGEVTARVGEITPQGGTNIAAALELGYATALRHYQVGSINRVVLLTDGAANLGDVNPAALKQKVEAHRKQGVALDCFGIGWEGLNDDLLEQLSRNGDGRYGFINTPEEAATEFAAQLAGALRVAASDVKVQVEFNPRRVTAYRQIGYAKHQLTKEQFRDNTVDAAEIGAAESGNALYVVEVNPRGAGDLATVRVRFKVPGTFDYREHEWTVPFDSAAVPLEQASPALRLAGTASAFSEWLVVSPYAAEVTTDRLLSLLNGVPAIYGADPRPQRLEWMIRTAKSVSGR